MAIDFKEAEMCERCLARAEEGVVMLELSEGTKDVLEQILEYVDSRILKGRGITMSAVEKVDFQILRDAVKAL